ncbi:hypothetical protein SAMN04515647_3803 [Cohaesibacter sp. ES.047]|uniref:hypothetical protein n=1 Tax=Cohaesibacter sp. ES.047 TaxID=1798205 RepID=UPI000BB793FC|nr:hypothetical protein [Cohaesibacter sp. ES.047]SNY93506.1 hypothetical protein SAMN04515647_3803 [Cohaesibacter sp. ES.047]
MIDELEIVRAACNRIGLEAPEDLSSEVQSGITALRAYNLEARAALALYPWSFAQKLYRLSRSADAPIAGYRHIHQLPVEDIVLGADRLIDDPTVEDDNFTTYKKVGTRIYSNVEDLFAIMRVDAGPHLWNPIFAKAVSTGLAGFLAEAIASDGKTADRLIREAYGDPREERRGGLMRAAINADGYTTPNRRMRKGNNPLSAAYMS